MSVLTERKEWVDEALARWVRELQNDTNTGRENLRRSIEYSLVRGGKRFRPVLSLLIGETFAVSPKRILPWAMAVEMIHTYSLIHDDLPCMDNDSERRGEPTNHLVFGDATALLAGDTLLTESFGQLARSYEQDPAIALELVRLLSEASGWAGMVSGQVMDLQSKEAPLSIAELETMHELKTGALIRVSSEGAAVLCGLPLSKRKLCRDFGASLGFAFQLQDDLLDSSQQIERGSFPDHLGRDATRAKLEQVSSRALDCLRQLGAQEGALADLVRMNLERLH